MKRPLSKFRPFGPFVSSSKDVDSTNLLFRGAALDEFNADKSIPGTERVRTGEFVDGLIEGRDIVMWVVSSDVSEGDYNTIQELIDNGLIVDKISRPVTGGLSKNLGTSMRMPLNVHALTEIKSLPMVLFIDKTKVEQELIDVKYTNEFIQDEPLIAGAIDKGSKMLGVKDDNVFKEFYSVDGRTIEWQKDPLDKFNSLYSEQEVVSYSDTIDISNSVNHVVTYMSKNLFRNIDSSNLDNVYTVKNAARKIYTMIQQEMKMFSDRLVMVLYEDMWIQPNDRKVAKDQFLWAYDGKQFIEDYNSAVPFSDPTGTSEVKI